MNTQDVPICSVVTTLVVQGKSYASPGFKMVRKCGWTAAFSVNDLDVSISAVTLHRTGGLRDLSRDSAMTKALSGSRRIMFLAVKMHGTMFASQAQSLYCLTRVGVEFSDKRSPGLESLMPGRMDTFGLTDIGLVRERNDDQFLIADLKKSVIIHQTSLSYDDETHLMGGSQAKLLLVADGVGGNPAGDQASRLAVQGIVHYLLNTMHWLFRLNDGREDAFLDDLKGALAFTQEKIRQDAEKFPLRQKMGTTITLAYIVWPQVYLIHVGDSRAYVVRGADVIHLTHDQTYAQALVDAGLMDESDVRRSPLRHVLSGLVGCSSVNLTPEISQFKLAFGDKLLLCTDGLTIHLNDSEISNILSVAGSAEEACRTLVNAANEAGGRDNITVVLAHFTDGTKRLLAEREVAAKTVSTESSAMAISLVEELQNCE